MKIEQKTPDISYEENLWQHNCQWIAGLDEAGRGAWAGPVSAAAVILPCDEKLSEILPGVRDSKLMTPKQRNRWADEIMAQALFWGVGFSSNEEIDDIGIVPATRLAMQRAIEQLSTTPQHLLIDALSLPGVNLPQDVIIRGDQHSLSIAAASILAKTARDRLMISNDSLYPGYHFDRHKGYGTALHRQALTCLSPCELHRRSFKPVRVCLENQAHQTSEPLST